MVLLGIRTVVRNAEWNDQIAFLEMHRAKFPDDPDILARLGNYYFGRGAVNMAIEVTERARANEHRFNTYYSQARRLNIATNLVTMYLTIGNVEAAAREARRAVALNPREPIALRSLAAVEMARQDYPAAQHAWRQLIAVQPEEPVAWLGLREASRLIGERRAAELADARYQELSNRPPGPDRRPRAVSTTTKSAVIFGLTLGALLIAFMSVQTVWRAFNNQQKLRMKALEDRPSS
jgi:tetratricopeptide (TPR) repeat protein